MLCIAALPADFDEQLNQTGYTRGQLVSVVVQQRDDHAQLVADNLQ